MNRFLDIVLHFDKYVSLLFQQYGTLTYIFLFLIIFAETGFVLTPFLPGDSLLFAVGAFAGTGALNVGILFVLLTAAAILGDTVNYWMGYHLGPKVFTGKLFFKQEYLDKTNQFYVLHGKKTIFLARFVPIVRTFAPFVAGIGRMHYSTFLIYNIIGGVVWVGLLLLLGYFLGGLSFVQENFSLFIILIIIISFLPMVREVLKRKS